MRRIVLALTAALTLINFPAGTAVQAAVQTAAPATSGSVEARSKALVALLAEIWEDKLKHAPEFASTLGDKRYDAQLSDYSVTEVNASLARGLGFIQRLGAIDTAGLTDQERLSSELMMRSLIEQQEGSQFKEWQMPVNQFNGLHTSLPMLVAQLSFDTVKDYDNYIARLKKIPAAFAQVRTNMELGMEAGRVPPAYLMEKVVVQASTLANQKPADSPFAMPIKKFPKTVGAAEQKRITEEVLAAITTDVLPAYRRFAGFMKVQYVPMARKEMGIWSIPDGDAYYAFLVKQSTTLNKTPDEIHAIGLAEVKRDEAEMLAIIKKMGFADIKSFSAALKANPKEHPASKGTLMEAYRIHLAEMKPRLPELFGRLPKASLEVVAIPGYAEKDQAAAYYEPGTPDGSRPGRVNVNTYNFAERSLAAVENVAYHEGVPGHHLQTAIAQELTGVPEFRKQSYYTAYTEGWALYSERLGKEIGFYTDPYSDYGRLEGDMWRAIRLVVDTGVHSKHWTRQQMVDFFHDHSAIDETNVQAEVDRYIAWPGQALGYKIGQLEILELRARAQAALGTNFSLKGFHDVVLDSGALPMDVLEKQVDAWIAEQKSGAATK
jgi:uncharacterized protein (DUF885 family)